MLSFTFISAAVTGKVKSTYFGLKKVCPAIRRVQKCFDPGQFRLFHPPVNPLNLNVDIRPPFPQLRDLFVDALLGGAEVVAAEGVHSSTPLTPG